MRTLKVGVQVLPVNKSGNDTVALVLDRRASPPIEAEVLDISPRFCRLRIVRNGCFIDRGDVRIRFARTDVVARVVWTNTSEESIELGLMLPAI